MESRLANRDMIALLLDVFGDSRSMRACSLVIVE